MDIYGLSILSNASTTRTSDVATVEASTSAKTRYYCSWQLTSVHVACNTATAAHTHTVSQLTACLSSGLLIFSCRCGVLPKRKINVKAENHTQAEPSWTIHIQVQEKKQQKKQRWQQRITATFPAQLLERVALFNFITWGKCFICNFHQQWYACRWRWRCHCCSCCSCCSCCCYCYYYSCLPECKQLLLLLLLQPFAICLCLQLKQLLVLIKRLPLSTPRRRICVCVLVCSAGIMRRCITELGN